MKAALERLHMVLIAVVKLGFSGSEAVTLPKYFLAISTASSLFSDDGRGSTLITSSQSLSLMPVMLL